MVQTHETLASQDPSESKTQDALETPPEHSQISHQNKTVSPSDGIQSQERTRESVPSDFGTDLQGVEMAKAPASS